ncbi:hypothetical protein D1872_198750 [compost metagenome]
MDSIQPMFIFRDSNRKPLTDNDKISLHGAGAINFSCVTSVFNRWTASSLLIKRVINLETIKNKMANSTTVNAIACTGTYMPKLLACNTFFATIKNKGAMIRPNAIAVIIATPAISIFSLKTILRTCFMDAPVIIKMPRFFVFFFKNANSE